MSLYSTKKKRKKNSLFSNPVAIICGFFCIVPGILIGQMTGLMLTMAYVPLVALGGGAITGFIGYLFNLNSKRNKKNFFKYGAIGLGSVIGALWGGMILSPLLLSSAAFLSTEIALILGVAIGILAVGGITWIIMQFIKNPTSTGINLFATSLIGMTLFGCVGLMFGPQIWMLSLNLGLVVGAIAGVLHGVFTKNTQVAKVLASLLAMSTALIGVMLGAIVGAFMPFISPAIISVFFGAAFMLGGAFLGSIIGNGYSTFDLTNKSLRMRLYQAAALLPVIFFGYLTGGVVGFLYLPLNEILLSQAIGMIVASSLYGLVLSAFYLIKSFFSSSSETKKSLTEENLQRNTYTADVERSSVLEHDFEPTNDKVEMSPRVRHWLREVQKSQASRENTGQLDNPVLEKLSTQSNCSHSSNLILSVKA